MEISSPDSLKSPAPPSSDLRTLSIGLSLSGGGYRAAVFHLGTLAYLYRVHLLPQIRRLSTVSGGTFTGAKYILSLVEGIEFEDFFCDFYGFLSEARLIQEGLDKLSEGDVRVPSGQRKLITALANVYADTFLQSPDGKAYTFGQIMDATIPVQEVIFNAIEFRTGTAFRFQKSASPDAEIGNGNVSIPKEEAKKIRVADIVAASSCFPGGFEPLAFPDDFVWPDNQIPVSVRQAIQNKKPVSRPDNYLGTVPADNLTNDNVIALMDGGIYDNQGLSSLLLADERKQSKKLDLVIISDVDPTNDDLYQYPRRQTSSGNLTLGQIEWLIWLFIITCALTVGAIVYELWSEITQGTFVFWQHFFSALMPLTLVSLVIGVLGYGWQVFRKQVFPLIPQVGVDGWRQLKTLKLNEVIHLIRLRVSSLLVLTAAIFMDRIRALNFERVYANPSYLKKRISNRIDRLIARPIEVPGVAQPTEALLTVVRKAVNMPTTLWFDLHKSEQEAQIEALTIAGQVTICFNLMQYIYRCYGDNPAKYPPEIQIMWDALQKDWATLNDDPKKLLEVLLHRS